MSKPILVPLDGSGFAEHALGLALTLSRRTGSPLELVFVHEPVLLVEPSGTGAMLSDRADAALREQEQAHLQATAERVREAVTVPVNIEMLEGSVVDALLGGIKEAQAQWVVMSTHGRGPLSRFWLGSVADGLVRRSPVPLVLIRPRNDQANFAKDVSIGQVVICLDGSQLAEEALGPAIALAKTLDAEVRLLSVVKPPLLAGHDPTHTKPDVFGQPATGQMPQVAEKYLEQTAQRLASNSLKAQYSVVVDRHPASAILSYGQQRPDSLLALATHGRGGLGRALLGSVADKVIRGASVPVFVCRPS